MTRRNFDRAGRRLLCALLIGVNAANCIFAASAAGPTPPVPPVRPDSLPAEPGLPVPPERPKSLDAPGAPAPPGDKPTAAAHGANPDCLARLEKTGVVIDRRKIAPAPQSEACSIEEPVALVSARNEAGLLILFPERPMLACTMAESVARYALDVLNPAARASFDKDISAIGTGPGHDCRPRNRQAGARMSAHSRGLAIDIMHIAFVKGPPLVVEKRDAPGQAAFVAKLLETACVAFNTVLGPDADSFHLNNIHIDMEPRGRDGRTKYCR